MDHISEERPELLKNTDNSQAIVKVDDKFKNIWSIDVRVPEMLPGQDKFQTTYKEKTLNYM